MKDDKNDVMKLLSKLNVKDSKKEKAPPKKILRAPVVSTYTRGVSGLPRRMPHNMYDSDGQLGPKSRHQRLMSRSRSLDEGE